ncbi:diaminopropionate ammonia-lyase [Pseudooceanicola batsensis HTCC2597]|uniref:Diaminopropionate ammonia-lyase n=1 Tax=Pseudooceanicola batsensis (strain ATCC BAA-863 / DSM 15984 / KCTC 12145 / HTCC2597) TaxID=252305 RepID=A3TVD6_PSEBH|nr:pyridoxal-phosphate dependent enzyme [Pseudooceanicola batsensis]EAQ04482.1 diaminopropionate ammonia-lyase [Pseudooceanicola batsensis HTCC2597]
MTDYLENPYRGTGLLSGAPRPRSDPAPVARLLAHCPRHAATPMEDSPDLARAFGVGRLSVKDERGRMGLGSFKALGAAHVIARDAAGFAAGQADGTTLTGRAYVAASAGNHGLSVAAGAAVFGATAVIYLAETVPEAFADRLRHKGATVVRAGADYQQSMDAAAERAEAEGWTLLSDSSWDGYLDPAIGVMEGYLQLAAEAVAQLDAAPTHILLQAGVGGLAAAAARHFRRAWGDAPQIIVVEPDRAPALIESIREGALVTAKGPETNMGRLDCKTPSLVALAGLSEDADGFVTISDAQAETGVGLLRRHGLASTPSGAAGAAALIGGLPGIGTDAHVLIILSEGPEDA